MRRNRGFTLVEVLIVVVILGVLSAVVVPQFSRATEEAGASATVSQLTKVRNALAVYYVRNQNQWPTVAAGEATWGEILSTSYLRRPPENKWVSPDASKLIVIGTEPDTEFHNDYGWIFDPSSGNLWAAAFDADDKPFPRE